MFFLDFFCKIVYFISERSHIFCENTKMNIKNINFSRALSILFLFIAAVFLLLTGCSGKADNSGSDKPNIISADKSTPDVPSPTDITDDEPGSVPDIDSETEAALSPTKTEPDTPPAKTDPDISPAPQYTIVLDPGHGGRFSGAVYYGMAEKNMTLTLANYLRDYLINNYTGVTVYMTRELDMDFDDDIVKELEKRAIIAKGYNADYFVSLHFNASEAHDAKGASIYASRSLNVTDKSKELGSCILSELTGLGLYDNGVTTRSSSDHFDDTGYALDYYAVLRHNAARDIPAVIVEHCFMDNAEDQAFLGSDEKLKVLAEADARGIAKFLGLKQVSP